MPFVPKSGEHSIVEVVFGLQFNRPFGTDQLDAIAADEAFYKPLFPTRRPAQSFQISFGAGLPTAQGVARPTSSVFFEGQADGKVTWLLRVDGQNIFVNCLAYTRWDEVWGAVRPYLDRAATSVSEGNLVTGIMLQYIDQFDWTGDISGYSLSGLLKAGPAVPKSLLDKGPNWHLHQGWYREERRLGQGRHHERVNLDGTLDNGVPTVRIDSYLKFDPAKPLAFRTGDVKRKAGRLVPLFETLHTLDKDLLKAALAPKAAKLIKLSI